MKWLPAWPPRDWRMMFALAGLAVSGAGAWLLAKWSLDSLVAMSVALSVIWPLAYYSYGALAILAIPTLLFGVVVGLKSFAATGPGGSRFEVKADDDDAPTVITTTETKVTP